MKTVASLDLGTSKIVALVAEIDSYGDMHVIGIGEVPSKGIEKGQIKRLDLAVGSILRAIKEAQEMAGVKLNSVNLGISSPLLKSQNERDTINISPQPVEIDEAQIDRIIERATTRAREEGYEIISAIPRKFILDEQEGVLYPVGLLGSKLAAEVHIVKVGTTLLRNVEKAVKSSGLNIADKYPSIIASAEAVLTQEEKEEGALLLDIGASLTDFILFTEGSPILTGTIPMGGNSITKDIAHFMKVNIEQAERIKLEHGFALSDLVNDSERIKIKPRGEDKEAMVSKKSLAEVIQIRLEEIADRVLEYINSQGINISTINAGIILTGGSSKLGGIKEFFERYMDLPARIGYPMGVIGLKERIQDPAYSTAVGLLRLKSRSVHGYPVNYQNPQNVASEDKIKLNGWLDKLKSFFKEVL
ncbi:cell division protein FtsA [Thermocrinis sp.]|uniref:cell division protein FtsA n=1 Tax=Thermocrinis sp. TaxID=2024383 RepID=UPI002FDEE5BC